MADMPLLNILRPNNPERMRPAKSRKKPTEKCESLAREGSKGWLTEASHSACSGWEDIGVGGRVG